jgi:hypothetical protein
MNAQIKLLAGEALDKAVSYTWTKLDYDQIQELLACHAELVIKECMQTLINNGYDDAAKCLQDVHFGLDNPV